MPASRQSAWNFSADTMSRPTGSQSSLCHLKPTAPRRWPFSKTPGSTLTSTKRTFSLPRFSYAQSVETRGSCAALHTTARNSAFSISPSSLWWPQSVPGGHATIYFPPTHRSGSRLEEQPLPRGELQHRLGLPVEEFVDRLPRAGADLEAVVVEQKDPAANQAGVEELDRVARRLVEVHVDVDEAERPLLDLGEARRDPAGEHLQMVELLEPRAEVLFGDGELAGFEVRAVPRVRPGQALEGVEGVMRLPGALGRLADQPGRSAPPGAALRRIALEGPDDLEELPKHPFPIQRPAVPPALEGLHGADEVAILDPAASVLAEEAVRRNEAGDQLGQPVATEGIPGDRPDHRSKHSDQHSRTARVGCRYLRT